MHTKNSLIYIIIITIFSSLVNINLLPWQRLFNLTNIIRNCLPCSPTLLRFPAPLVLSLRMIFFFLKAGKRHEKGRGRRWFLKESRDNLLNRINFYASCARIVWWELSVAKKDWRIYKLSKGVKNGLKSSIRLRAAKLWQRSPRVRSAWRVFDKKRGRTEKLKEENVNCQIKK